MFLDISTRRFMNTSTSRNVTIVVLLIMTVVLIASSIFIALRLQTSTTPDATGATGFGDDATTDLFAPVIEMMFAMQCEEFIRPIGAPVGTTMPFVSEIKETYFEGGNNSVFCVYDVSDYYQFTFYVKGYGVDAIIDDNQPSLIARVKTQILGSGYTDITNVTIGPVKYHFAETADGRCITLFFHDKNDFEFGHLEFTKMESCGYVAGANSTISQTISENLKLIMNKFYTLNGKTDLLN